MSDVELAVELQRAANRAGKEWAYHDLVVRAAAALRAPAVDARPSREAREKETTRLATIEECAQLIESGAGMADLIDQDELDQQAKYIRALSDKGEAPPPQCGVQTATPDAMGRAFYLARYEHAGAKWEANDHKVLWIRMAQRYHEILSSPVPSADRGRE